MRTSKNYNLYNKDFVAWAFLQADLLKHHKFNEIDFEHIAEEIEDLGKKHRRELYNRLSILMAHLLKMEYQPKMVCQSWKSTIFEQRKHLRFLLKENPSLKSVVSEFWNECFELAKEEAILEMGDFKFNFPKECNWTEEQVLESLFK